MGGVDAIDKMVKAYTVNKTTYRWNVRLFLDVWDICLLNCYKLHMLAGGKWGKDRCEFLAQVAIVLVSDNTKHNLQLKKYQQEKIEEAKVQRIVKATKAVKKKGEENKKIRQNSNLNSIINKKNGGNGKVTKGDCVYCEKARRDWSDNLKRKANEISCPEIPEPKRRSGIRFCVKCGNNVCKSHSGIVCEDCFKSSDTKTDRKKSLTKRN